VNKVGCVAVGRFLCVWSGFSVFLRVFYGGESTWCFAVYGRLVLLYYIPSVGSSVIYPALVSARFILALTSATPGMPYADVRALGISIPGRSLSRVIPAGAVRTVRSLRSPVALREHVRAHIALRARVPSPPTGSTRPTRASVGAGFFFPDVVIGPDRLTGSSPLTSLQSDPA
jgi:hypothetical protein